MKFQLSFLLAFWGILFSALAHDPNLDAAQADAAAQAPLGANYVITFTLSAGGTEQKADLITSRRGVSFDLVTNSAHTFRFKGQLRPEEADHVTLSYNAVLITMTNAAAGRQVATTSGEGAVLLQFGQRMTILRSDRQELSVSVRPLVSPTPAPSASPAPASP